jgi:hypothetical protein
MVVVFVLGNPETQTVSYSFPKVCAALQRKFGTHAAYRADDRYVLGIVIENESVQMTRSCVLFRGCGDCLANPEATGLFGITHRT